MTTLKIIQSLLTIVQCVQKISLYSVQFDTDPPCLPGRTDMYIVSSVVYLARNFLNTFDFLVQLGNILGLYGPETGLHCENEHRR